MTKHPDWQTEVQHLADMRETIKKLLAEKVAQGLTLTEEQSTINKDMWEETRGFNDLEGITEFMQHIDHLKQNMAWARFNREEITRLDRLFLSPYFARIDFGAMGEPIAPCYIGITTLMDDDTANVYIYDWRAPLSNLYYDSEPGDVQYISPSGPINGQMTLKRQYRLNGGQLVLMFDASLAIQDDILQELLASATGGRMKQIVTSIQKEQNKAIRHVDHAVLGVQGPAGSGKTSIAMHRAAFLLYHHRNKLKSENLVILSPNALLGGYIANVLPELGEEEISGTPFTTLAEDSMDLSAVHVERLSEFMEDMLLHPSEIRKVGIAVKNSAAFMKTLSDFASALADFFPFEDILYNGRVLVSKKEMHQLYTVDFRRMPIGHRLERIRIRIVENLKQVERLLLKQKKADMQEDDPSMGEHEANTRGRLAIRHELIRLREEVDLRIKLDPMLLYARFITDKVSDDMFKTVLANESEAEVARMTTSVNYPAALFVENPTDVAHIAAAVRQEVIDNLDAAFIPYEDLAPIFFIALHTNLCEPETKVQHLLVDEAQDYSVMQYEVLKLLFPKAAVTLLGDENQNILVGFSIGSVKQAAKQLAPNDHLLIHLQRSYRSTLEIGHFADAYQLSHAEPKHFGRNGEKPALLCYKELTDIPEMALALLAGSEKSESATYSTLALVTRTFQEAEALYALFQTGSSYNKSDVLYGGQKVHLVRESAQEDLKGLLIIPSYLTKGLEFEHVVVTFFDKDTYSASEEIGLFHTVCTRALHQLTFLSPALPTVLATLVDSSLFIWDRHK